jgi:hypothetical protein
MIATLCSQAPTRSLQIIERLHSVHWRDRQAHELLCCRCVPTAIAACLRSGAQCTPPHQRLPLELKSHSPACCAPYCLEQLRLAGLLLMDWLQIGGCGVRRQLQKLGRAQYVLGRLVLCWGGLCAWRGSALTPSC